MDVALRQTSKTLIASLNGQGNESHIMHFHEKSFFKADKRLFLALMAVWAAWAGSIIFERVEG
ncbi:hypothetical protein [Endozoicomonas arenosclerae]|uniref:hypothetical protein n=1 Tax=Endozoicomonas arenosclerae TaxID=1633495 RepID=UPI000780979D|nr:hypothetical protein [Endozoicomonas arenosclerae]